MAEKIDKNEYVDNSKVFFDFLLHTHQWSNITPVEYAKWLSNFNDIPDGQYIACRLLNRFLYYSDKDIKKLLVDAINDVYSQQVVLPLQLSKDFSSLPSENEYEINEAIKRTLFIPLTPWGTQVLADYISCDASIIITSPVCNLAMCPRSSIQ